MKKIDKQKRKKQRKLRSKLIKGNLARPRVVLFKSNRYLIAQAIDDEKGNTLIYLDRTNLIEDKEKTKNIPQCLKNKE
jgi:large subunit ribosomal protein L18